MAKGKEDDTAVEFNGDWYSRTFLDGKAWLDLEMAEARYVFHHSRSLPELIAFYENHPSAATDREPDSVAGTASAEDTRDACIGSHQ